MKGVLILKALILKNITKKYSTGKNSYFTALQSTNISFDGVGLTSIIGKSGSGKSTLINIISRIDEPTSGEVYLFGKSYKKKRIERFFNKDIGIVFQSYNLIEQYSALYNVELPLLINGYSPKLAKEKATEILKQIGIPSEIINNKTGDLSGGEKQRVAISRALVNNPKILVCDEPTGALDSVNSIKIMEILKEISKTRLVLIVSHNLQLVKQYSDRIIEISDGKIIKDKIVNKVEETKLVSNKNSKNSSSWINKFSFLNFKRRLKRNLFSVLALTISLTMFILTAGFISHKDESIKEACYRQLDYGSGVIYKETKTGSSAIITLTKSTRPKLKELTKNENITQIFEICPNFDAIFPSNASLLYQDKSLNDVGLFPLYNFDQESFDHSLVIKGKNVNFLDSKEVIINESAYVVLSQQLGKDVLNETIKVDHQIEVPYYSEYGDTIIDTFYFKNDFIISSVVKELNYLNTPKIYYSYSFVEEVTKDNILNNLSTYLSKKVTWYDRIIEADDNSYLSSYSFRLFLKKYQSRELELSNIKYGENLVFSSSSLTIKNSLIDFLKVAEYGLILFLVISLIGTVIIISIISFASYSEDRKNSAILTSIGASKDNILDIYFKEAGLTGLISLFSALFLSFGLGKLINLVIFNLIDLSNLIVIPLKSFLGIPFLFPFILFIGLFFLIGLSTIFPISFSKSKTIKGELQSL